jgi:predicted dehydrogenase
MSQTLKRPEKMKSPDDGPILFGIIGSGEIVRMILPTLRKNDGLRVVAVAGTNPSAATLFEKEPGGAAVYADYADLLKRREIAAVYIATPPYLHCQMVEAALQAGKHVVCEKPMVMNLGELQKVRAAHQRHPELKVASCSSRFNVCPPVRKARDLIAEGRLGQLLRVRLQNSFEFPIPLELLPAWKRSRTKSGGGLCMDWGVYDLDWLQFLLGRIFDPVALMGSIDCFCREDTDLETGYAANLLCRNGLTISLERRPEHGPRFQRAEIRGTDCGLDLPFMPGGESDTLALYSHAHDRTLQKEILPVSMNDWDTILAFPVIDLAQAIAEKREVASPLSVQDKIYKVIAALYQSAATGKSVEVA